MGGNDVDREVITNHPVPVEIKNWADPIKPPYVKRTTIRTYIIDPAATDSWVQISDYEPKRLRMVINVIDAAVTLTMESPVNSPDTSTASVAPQGRHLSISGGSPGYDFFGPDAFFLNALAAVTRVCVTKEYC
jgi:hypothetical protein